MLDDKCKIEAKSGSFRILLCNSAYPWDILFLFSENKSVQPSRKHIRKSIRTTYMYMFILCESFLEILTNYLEISTFYLRTLSQYLEITTYELEIWTCSNFELLTRKFDNISKFRRIISKYFDLVFRNSDFLARNPKVWVFSFQLKFELRKLNFEFSSWQVENSR